MAKMDNPVLESVRQAYVVMKTEIKKYFSGKRMLLFLVLLAIVLVILTSAPFLIGSDFSEGQMLTMYLTMSPLIVLMAATLFASITIVSEYEERTALIVFTRPISKASIFFGKLAASLIVTVGFVLLYYLYASLMMVIQFGSVDSGIPVSFGLACAYAFGCIGIAMLISSFMKKSNTATILTFVALMVVISAASMVLSLAGMNVSWMIDQAAGSISNCSPGYRDYTNEQLQLMAQMMMDPGSFIDFNAYASALIAASTTFPPGVLASEFLNTVMVDSGSWTFGAIGEMFGSMSVSAPDVLKDTFTMLAWGVVALVGSFILFLRREF